MSRRTSQELVGPLVGGTVVSAVIILLSIFATGTLQPYSVTLIAPFISSTLLLTILLQFFIPFFVAFFIVRDWVGSFLYALFITIVYNVVFNVLQLVNPLAVAGGPGQAFIVSLFVILPGALIGTGLKLGRRGAR